MEKVLLHSCCAPCSAAILEWLLANGYAPTIYFFNPNIYPQEEYMRRKAEIVRYAQELSVPIVDEDECVGQCCTDAQWSERHRLWLQEIQGCENEPERGARCLRCFEYRLKAAAKYAADNGFVQFTTTLASSRWKDLNQINAAGAVAEASVDSRARFWDRNWRKGGLYERRNILAKQFYNQQYCGCEFSMRHLNIVQENKY